MIALIKLDERELVHQLIILEYALRAVQSDYSKIPELKMGNAYLPLFDQLLADLTAEHMQVKRTLASKQIRLIHTKKLDAYFSIISVTTAGEDAHLQYANQVLKQDVYALLLQKVAKIYSN